MVCHAPDSIFVVVSQLARWFWFIEFWHLPEDMRLQPVINLLTEFCLTKHNGFISRLGAGQEQDVVNQIGRIVPCAINSVDDSGKEWFARIRRKRQLAQYSRIILLESVIKGEDGKTDLRINPPSSPLGLIYVVGIR